MYNVEKYIVQCLRSIYDNNRLIQMDLEVILVDDGSPDKAADIAEEYLKDKKNWRLIRQENKGLGGARNSGIKKAKGDYILFLDSDDFLLPNTLEQLQSKLKNLDVDILEFGAQAVDTKKNIVYTKSTSTVILRGVDYYNCTRYMNSACNKLYKRTFLTENNLLFLERIYIEDFEFNTRAFFLAKRVKGVKLIVSNFLQTPDSITRTTSTSKCNKMQLDILYVIETIYKYYRSQKKIDYHTHTFFQERLSFLTATLFYQLIKNRLPFKNFIVLRNKLIEKGLYFVNFPIFEIKKNIFRLIFLKNFFALKILMKNLN